MKTILFTLLAYVHVCFGQNLVPNPSFEQYNICPWTQGQINDAPPWFQPNSMGSSTDYYNACDTSIYWSVPKNYFGYQNAKTGNAYAGFALFDKNSYPYSANREYIEVELSSLLIGEKQYFVSFYVSRADFSQFAIDGIGAYFSSSNITTNDYTALSQFNPQIINVKGNIIRDTANWILISGSMLATGNEKFMIIGNFNTDSLTTIDSIGGKLDYNYHSAYYYIDDVSVTEDTTTSINNEQLTNNKIHLFPNPFKNILNITAPSKDIQSLTIANELGETVYQSNLTSNEQTLDLSFLSKGIYFVSLLSKESVYKKKILKVE